MGNHPGLPGPGLLRQARFVRLCTGLLFARGRRTVTSWLRGYGASRDYKRYYYLLGSVGRKAPILAGALLRILTKRLPAEGPDTPLVFAIDDSPTQKPLGVKPLGVRPI